MVKNLLEKQDRKVIIKLPHLFLCKTCSFGGPEQVVTA